MDVIFILVIPLTVVHPTFRNCLSTLYRLVQWSYSCVLAIFYLSGFYARGRKYLCLVALLVEVQLFFSFIKSVDIALREWCYVLHYVFEHLAPLHMCLFLSHPKFERYIMKQF